MSACLYLVRNSLRLKETRNIIFGKAWIWSIIKQKKVRLTWRQSIKGKDRDEGKSKNSEEIKRKYD